MTEDSFRRDDKKNQKVILSVFLMYAVFGAKSLSSLVILPITQRYLDINAFNTWVLLQALGSYLFISEMGITQIVMNLTGDAYSKGEINKISSLAFNSFSLFLVISFVISAISIFLVQFFHVESLFVKDYSEVQNILPLSLVFFIPLTMLRFPFRVFSAVLNGLRSLHVRLVVDLIHPILFVIVILVTLRFTADLFTLVISSTLSILLVFSLFLPLTKHLYKFINLKLSNFDLDTIKMFANSMLKYAPIPFCLLGQRFVPTFILSASDSLSFVPVLYLIIMVFRVFLFFTIDSISKGFQPYIIHYNSVNNEQQIHLLWRISTKFTTLLALVIIALSLLWYEAFSDLILGANNILFPSVLLIFAVICLLDSIFSTSVNILIAVNEYAKLSKVWLLELSLGILLGILGAIGGFVQPIVGISLGFLLAKIVIAVPGHLILYADYQNTSIRDIAKEIFGLKVIPSFLLFGIFTGLIMNGDFVSTQVQKMLFSLCILFAFSLIIWFYAFSADEKKWLLARAAPIFKHKIFI